MERHIQSILQALILAALIWVGGTLIDLKTASATTQASLAEVKEQIKAMDGRFDTYLPRSEAEVRFNALDAKHAEYERRIGALEQQNESRGRR